MTIIFQLILIASLWCFGFHVAIKNFLAEAFDFDIDTTQWERLSRIEQILYKPLFACPYCMASVHGTGFFWFAIAYINHKELAWFWIPFCIVLCGFNYVINEVIYK